jgi:hypothetical protein
VVVGRRFHDRHDPLIALLSDEERTAVGEETEPAERAEQVQ